MNDYQVLARRYRPQNFSEILGQESIVTTLKNAIRLKRMAHAYLFCGSRGTGKTTLARVVAKGLNCSSKSDGCEPCGQCSSCKEIAQGASLEVLEIDGASHRGIDDVRQINETVGYSAPEGKYKVYIIDEVHMLTKEAFNALLKTLEEPPPKVIFIFATTEPHKVPSTILSRCQRFNLKRIPLDKIVAKLQFMMQQQNVEIEEEALRLIAQRADGGFRDAESLLDQILSYHDGVISAKSVTAVLGIVSNDILFSLDEAGKQGHLIKAFEISHQIYTEGKDLFHFVELLTLHFRTLLMLKVAGKEAPFIDLSLEDLRRYETSAKLYSQEQCLTIIDFLVKAQGEIRFSPSPRIALEALLLRILRIHQRIPIDFLVRRLMELEEAIGKAPLENIPVQLENIPVQLSENSKGEISSHSQTDGGESRKMASTLKSESDISESFSQKKEDAEESKESDSLPLTPTLHLENSLPAAPVKIFTEEEQKAAKKKQSRYDTILQFAAVELEGSLQKKPIKGF